MQAAGDYLYPIRLDSAGLQELSKFVVQLRSELARVRQRPDAEHGRDTLAFDLIDLFDLREDEREVTDGRKNVVPELLGVGERHGVEYDLHDPLSDCGYLYAERSGVKVAVQDVRCAEGLEVLAVLEGGGGDYRGKAG